MRFKPEEDYGQSDKKEDPDDEEDLASSERDAFGDFDMGFQEAEKRDSKLGSGEERQGGPAGLLLSRQKQYEGPGNQCMHGDEKSSALRPEESD